MEKKLKDHECSDPIVAPGVYGRGPEIYPEEYALLNELYN